MSDEERREWIIFWMTLVPLSIFYWPILLAILVGGFLDYLRRRL